MSMKDGGQAFPRAYESKGSPGMSLRDYFAGQIICGLANVDKPWGELAKMAYAGADDMLTRRDWPEREPTKKPEVT